MSGRVCVCVVCVWCGVVRVCVHVVCVCVWCGVVRVCVHVVCVCVCMWHVYVCVHVCGWGRVQLNMCTIL